MSGWGPAIGAASRIGRTTKEITLDGNDETKSHSLFLLTGVVLIHRIWGIVTEAIGANHTDAHLRLNDGAATVPLSKSTTADLSAHPLGSWIKRDKVLTEALTGLASATCAASERIGMTVPFPDRCPVRVIAKNGADTYLEYRYTTTDTPTSGKIRWYCEWAVGRDGVTASWHKSLSK